MTSTIKTATSRWANFSLIGEHLLVIRLKDNMEVELADSREMQKISLELTEGRKFVSLVDARVKIVVSKEAREWGSTPEAQKNMLAQAILVNTLANKLVGNFIIQFHKPPARTRMFSDEESSLSWLNEQLKGFGLK